MHGTTDEMAGFRDHIFGLAGTAVGKADDCIAMCKIFHPGTYFFHDACKITSLPGRKMRGPLFVHPSFTYGRFTRIDAGCAHLHQHLIRVGFVHADVVDMKDIDAAIAVEFYGAVCLWIFHDWPFGGLQRKSCPRTRVRVGSVAGGAAAVLYGRGADAGGDITSADA